LTGLGLILGGGAGNVHDRLRYGAVVDFLDLHLGEAHWPAFNLADVSVCLGAGLLAFTVLFGRGPFGPKAKDSEKEAAQEAAGEKALGRAVRPAPRKEP
jgi:lipoprotein signal peptidase